MNRTAVGVGNTGQIVAATLPTIVCVSGMIMLVSSALSVISNALYAGATEISSS